MVKKSCCKCPELAVWYYMPMSDNHDIYFCDYHVKRGCSCNIDYITGKEDVDERGRLYPCCEYGYDETGFDEEPDPNDKYAEYESDD